MVGNGGGKEERRDKRKKGVIWERRGIQREEGKRGKMEGDKRKYVIHEGKY